MATYCGPGDYGNECWKARSGPKEKRCANSTLDLYFAVDFFCCDQDTKGFEVNSNDFVGINRFFFADDIVFNSTVNILIYHHNYIALSIIVHFNSDHNY
ncbi:hypothetical protein Asppvi_009246 [Aspergillus pseudoviridinutans]|uniref:Uncharacterized protein n=1 Tax=Aspergillus pseudoviridinutans TaxID=1517512 RepID=A0A9P3EY93_9EURO|nr:uncharacterized protein Asppvi_009246 [Aspergillus pseudoviridinutans]GIJ90292.1 hypothetical protein Asppvi_009246 [Aspergillus pseudoviridinutans]